ncbi:hypothetical protein [Pseudomonas sp. PAGU 2196]|nr:hypothetical protein [Pseudomonas sp. PAGU 2196]
MTKAVPGLDLLSGANPLGGLIGLGGLLGSLCTTPAPASAPSG